MATAYIALGSNLGDKPGTLFAAVRELNATPNVRVTRLSTFHNTAPVGGPPDQPRFLNAAAELSTTLTPAALLQTLLDVEKKFGRVRGVKDGPRTLDLDLLLYDDLVQTDRDPIVPHPRMHQRRFVLAPLHEIAKDVLVPGLGRRVHELLATLPPEPQVENESETEAHAEDLRGRESVSAPTRKPLEGLKTLVTGSTRGIGKAIARAFAAAGAHVIVHGRKSVSAAAVAAELASAGAKTQALAGDLSNPEFGLQLLVSSWDTWGGLDVLVLNAGVDTLTGPAAAWPFERKLAELLAVDVTANVMLARAAGQRMLDQGHGVILTMGWDQAETGMEGDSGQLFAAAKGAIMAFTRSLAVSLAPAVRVNCIAPGWIRTAWGEGASKTWHDRVERETPLRRWGTPEDVAGTAVWLASPDASFVTGQIVRVNGGAIRS